MSSRLKHLLLATVEDPHSVKSWSGIPYSLRVALEGHVERLSIFRPSRPSRNLVDVLKRKAYGGTPPKYPLWMTRATLQKNARELRAEIDRVQPDAVLSISSQCIAMLHHPAVPVWMFSDSPWLAWMEAYEGTLSRPMLADRFAAQEAATARRIEGLCFGSQWAIEEAVRLYGERAEDGTSMRNRLHVTPLGSNWVPSLTREQILARMDARPTNTIELLYVGKDWERKGGPLAVQVAQKLHALGHAVRLEIVGCRPDLPAATAGYIRAHGLLYQSDPQQSATLAAMFERAHFLIVPTTAECFGIVFAEAQAFALPPISRRVHALPTVIVDGETGLLLDRDAPASAYVDRILALRANPQAYRAMAVKARDRFEASLNWNSTAEEIVRRIDGTMAKS
jgi:glycosyltransferase involved in cell wall biosynthesis